MDVLSRLKLLNALTALTPTAVFPVRSFTVKGICLHEPVQGLNLNRRSILGLEPKMPVTIHTDARTIQALESSRTVPARIPQNSAALHKTHSVTRALETHLWRDDFEGL